MVNEPYFNAKIEGLDLIVFDLDCTLWPFHVDCSYTPFKKDSKGHIVDARGKKVNPYPQVKDILQKLSSLGYKIGIASRTTAIKDGGDLVNLFGFKKYVNYSEIYPGCKVTHFNQFKKQSGIPFENMLFFDDESRNIVDIERLGAVAIYVRNGVNNNVIEEGLREFVKQRDKT